MYFEPGMEDLFFGHWSPIEICLSTQSLTDAKPLPDFSQLPPNIFLFSRYAVDALHDLLTSNGCLYPTTSEIGQFWAYRVTTYLQGMVESESDVRRNQGGRINQIKRISFNPDLITGVDIFKIPELPIRAFVSQRFADRVAEFKLKGINLHDANQPY